MQKAVNNYNAKNYERIYMRVKSGDGDKLKALAESEGLSVNSLLIAAVNEYAVNHTGEAILDVMDKSIIHTTE